MLFQLLIIIYIHIIHRPKLSSLQGSGYPKPSSNRRICLRLHYIHSDSQASHRRWGTVFCLRTHEQPLYWGYFSHQHQRCNQAKVVCYGSNRYIYDSDKSKDALISIWWMAMAIIVNEFLCRNFYFRGSVNSSEFVYDWCEGPSVSVNRLGEAKILRDY